MVLFRFFLVFFCFFFGFFGLNSDKKFQLFKNYVNNEILGGQELPHNTLNASKALQMSYKSYYNQQEPLNKNPLNQSKLAKMEKPKKTKKARKTEKKPLKNSPKFEICGRKEVWMKIRDVKILYSKFKNLLRMYQES